VVATLENTDCSLPQSKHFTRRNLLRGLGINSIHRDTAFPLLHGYFQSSEADAQA
jgi:hypothetical protein